MPFVVIVALLIASLTSGGTGSRKTTQPAVLPAVSVSPPADSSDPTVGTCSRIISAVPLRLAGLDLRRTTSDPPSSSIVAWGDPPVVLRCGVGRPKALVAGSTAQTLTVDGVVAFLVDQSGDATRYTVIDRSVYLDVDVPSRYDSSPLPAVAKAVAGVLPKPVCTTDPKVTDLSKLCTRRP